MNYQQTFNDAMELVRQWRPDIASLLKRVPVILNHEPDLLASWGSWDSLTNSMTLSPGTLQEAEDGAVTLIHEGTHALDSTSGVSTIGSNRVLAEQRATREGMKFLDSRYPNGARKPILDGYDPDANDWLAEFRKGTLDKLVEDQTRAIFGNE